MLILPCVQARPSLSGTVPSGQLHLLLLLHKLLFTRQSSSTEHRSPMKPKTTMVVEGVGPPWRVRPPPYGV